MENSNLCQWRGESRFETLQYQLEAIILNKVRDSVLVALHTANSELHTINSQPLAPLEIV